MKCVIARWNLNVCVCVCVCDCAAAGCSKDWLREFRRVRDSQIMQTAAETNRLVIRVEKVRVLDIHTHTHTHLPTPLLWLCVCVCVCVCVREGGREGGREREISLRREKLCISKH